eukprot:3380353-Prymnesium_polylepis.1
MALGYARELDDVIKVLSMRGEDGEKKQIEHEETGVFLYHKGRMTQLVKLKQQEKQSNHTATSGYRIMTLGMGISGIVQENYLVQHHTKTEYKPAVGTLQLFQQLLLDANKKLQSFIKPRVVKRYLELTGKDFKSIKDHACVGFAQGLGAQVAALGVPSASAADAGPSSSSAPAPHKHRKLESDVRMRPKDRNDAVVGRVVPVEEGTGLKQRSGVRGGPLYQLLLEPDGALSTRTYKASELEPTCFDAQRDLPSMLLPAPSTLVGCGARVKWQEEGGSSWWPAVLQCV